MSKWIVDIHGDIEGDYEIIEEYKEPKMGRWLAVENEDMETVGYYCSECDLPMETEEQTSFCPNCGATMEVEENG